MSDNFEECDFRIIKDLLNMSNFVLLANNFKNSLIVRIKKD